MLVKAEDAAINLVVGLLPPHQVRGRNDKLTEFCNPVRMSSTLKLGGKECLQAGDGGCFIQKAGTHHEHIGVIM